MLKTYENEDYISKIIQLPSGEIVTALLNLVIEIKNPYTGEIITNLIGHENSPESYAYLPKHDILASGALDKTIRLWNISNGDLIKTITGHTEAVNNLVVLPNGYLASSAYSNKVRIWNSNKKFSLERLISISGLKSVVAMALLNDGNLAIGDSVQGDIFIVNPKNGSLVKKILGVAETTITRIVVMSNGDFISSLAYSSINIKVWNGSDYSLKKTITTQDYCSDIAVLQNDYLACGTYEKILIYDINTGKIKQRILSGYYTEVFSVILLKNGELVTKSDRSIQLWTTGMILILHF